MPKKYDFAGWATKYNVHCTDGRTIMPDAFESDDGKRVPLVWNHGHNDPENVLGHAVLEKRPEGIYAYCSLNNTAKGQHMRESVKHGDVTGLSIYANQLKQQAGNVIHGTIRELSLVLAGANKEAFIDQILYHGEEMDDEAIIYPGYQDVILHANEEKEEVSDNKKPESDETIKDVFDTLSEKQKNVVYAMIGMALEGDKDNDSDEGGEDVKHNVFDQDTQEQGNYLSHSDMETIFKKAKQLGSLREAVEDFTDGAGIAHADGDDAQTYGIQDVDWLFPEYRNLNMPPEFIKRDMNWVAKVLNGAHHTPFSRIKSMFANITEDEARAKGYIKGKLKKEEVFSLLKRTTDPQTIYKKQKMDRDDIIDITDFDVVAWLKREMRMMLDEEIARAQLIGDGRLASDDDHISEDHVRPIAKDSDLFTVKVHVKGNDVKDIITQIIRSRRYYKGSGNPTFFTTEEYLTEMLLLEDGIGHPLYADEAALARKLRVKEIVTVPVMENQAIGEETLVGIIVNMQDYNVGADKGGQVAMFDDFDIDYNQQKYLIETRISGALTVPYSALCITCGALVNEVSPVIGHVVTEELPVA